MVTNNKVLLTNLILVMFLGSLLLTGCDSFPTDASSSSDTLSDTQIEPVSTNTSSKEMETFSIFSFFRFLSFIDLAINIYLAFFAIFTILFLV